MSDLQGYWLAQAKTKEARAKLDAAGARLELAEIKERLAELKSQHEPLNRLSKGDINLRNRLYSSAFYAVVGRFAEVTSK